MSASAENAVPAPEPEGRGGGPPRRVVVLGSTGSIGRQALEVAAVVPGLRVVGLAARTAAEEVVGQAVRLGVRRVALQDEAAARRARELAGGEFAGGVLPSGPGDGFPRQGAPQVLSGDEGLAELIEASAAEARSDGVPLTVLNGIVGAAGLRATLATLATGVTLALANKESLVAGGEFVVAAARRSGALILPVDSEHSAVLQCLQAARPASHEGVGAAGAVPGLGGRLRPGERIVLTGSGGPFRGRTRSELADVTPEEALRHPTWTMGRKITIDSATLMNKGLEVIEAHRLFGVPYEAIDVLVSPQSLVHAMVRLADGSTIAHLGLPDMRAPIAYALAYPERPRLPMARALDLTSRPLTFEEPDTATFGCLRLAYEAGMIGGGAPVVLNAADEVAVEAFLDGRLSFLGIEGVVADALARLAGEPVASVDDVFALDAETRRLVSAAL